jgi:hypothetical protein
MQLLALVLSKPGQAAAIGAIILFAAGFAVALPWVFRLIGKNPIEAGTDVRSSLGKELAYWAVFFLAISSVVAIFWASDIIGAFLYVLVTVVIGALAAGIAYLLKQADAR